MKVSTTSIEGVRVIESACSKDHRGQFSRVFCEQMLSDILGCRRIVQINHSITNSKGAIRGMHFQRPPFAEMKLIRCLSGSVFDVAVDIRQNSPTFLTYHEEILSAENGKMIVIPEGCAHGFQALEENCQLIYLHTAFYNPESEGGLKFDDPLIDIPWPLDFGDISERDKTHPKIDSTFVGITQ